jgi:hypothetical protein
MQGFTTMGASDPHRRYRKPETICLYSESWEKLLGAEDLPLFVDSKKREIEDRVSALGLHLRLANPHDMDGIMDLHRRCFPPATQSLETPYVLHRILNYGYTPVIESPDGIIVGANICVGYDDPDRTAYGVRITVDTCVSGHNLGAELVNYSCLTGMARGSHMRRGLLSPTNYGSASNFLNYVGYLCESFHPELPGFGPRFIVALPLTPGGIMNNRIDHEKLKAFVLAHEEGRDYLLLDPLDLEGIERSYRESSFRIAAFCKKGTIVEDNRFFALPKDQLGFPKDG